ncbi:MAG: hypothetical protein A2147_02625 [Chloroflexi bacterium RBG_16_57_8]|nr:MAG: hypothetical protein A2147_02625 [Chloroflexi bacterium RBG_16_57_8]
MPVLALLVAPFLGWKAAAYLAALLLAADLLVCRIICGIRVPVDSGLCPRCRERLKKERHTQPR